MNHSFLAFLLALVLAAVSAHVEVEVDSDSRSLLFSRSLALKTPANSTGAGTLVDNIQGGEGKCIPGKGCGENMLCVVQKGLQVVELGKTGVWGGPLNAKKVGDVCVRCIGGGPKILGIFGGKAVGCSGGMKCFMGGIEAGKGYPGDKCKP